MGIEPISDVVKCTDAKMRMAQKKASSKEIRDSSTTNHPYAVSAIRMVTDPETTRFMAFMSLIVAMLEEKEND